MKLVITKNKPNIYKSKIKVDIVLKLYLGILLYSISLIWGYLAILSLDVKTYKLDLNIPKLMIGLFLSSVCFFCIDHNKKKVSTFFLDVVLIFHLIPIAIIYGLENESTIFFFWVVFCMLICVGITKVDLGVRQLSVQKSFSRIVNVGIITIVTVFMVEVIIGNGIPSFEAFDLYSVYRIRSSGSFITGKLTWYILPWCIYVAFPFCLTWSILNNKRLVSMIIIIVVLVLFLYSGHKAFLFMLPLTIGCTFIFQKKIRSTSILLLVCIGIFVLTALAVLIEIEDGTRGFFREVHSLFVRRTLFVPAIIKYKYFDFFSNNPKIGFAGIFPRWLINIKSPYGDAVIGKIIAANYFNSPDMNSSTGAISTGFMRLGFIGTLIEFVLLSFFMKLFDLLQKRTSYPLVAGGFITIVFMWSGTVAMELFGPWLLCLIILLTFKDKKEGLINERWD